MISWSLSISVFLFWVCGFWMQLAGDDDGATLFAMPDFYQSIQPDQRFLIEVMGARKI